MQMFIFLIIFKHNLFLIRCLFLDWKLSCYSHDEICDNVFGLMDLFTYVKSMSMKKWFNYNVLLSRKLFSKLELNGNRLGVK